MNESIQAFVIKVQDARVMVERLDQYLADHMEKGPDEITWANVGDAARLANALDEICQTFGLAEQKKEESK